MLPHAQCYLHPTLVSRHNAMQINKNVISCPEIHSKRQGDKTNNSGRCVRLCSRARSEDSLLRWEGGCVVEMLICYSVCLWHDEKHSYQIHWRRGILGRDWSCCWLAWQQSRAWRLSDRNVHRKAFVLPVFSSERGMTQKNSVRVANLHRLSGRYCVD